MGKLFDFGKETMPGSKPFSNDGDSHSIMQNMVAFADSRNRRKKKTGIDNVLTAAQAKNKKESLARDATGRNKERDAYQGT